MKNILLPTDFSENSWNAISYASKLFKNEECKFYLLNTYQLVLYNTDLGIADSVKLSLINSVKQASEEGLEKINQRILKEFNNPKHIVSKISSYSSLTAEMEEMQRQYRIDFIVMGTKGATGANKILFGSNAIHVLNRAKCPVLAVPEYYDFEEPNEILFSSDYNIVFEKNQLKPLIDIATQYASIINVLHVFDYGRLTEEQLDNRILLEEHLKGITIKFKSEKNSSVTEGIQEFQSKSDTKLLVMIKNEHSFFENLFFKNKINQIGFDLNVPFLVIPST